MGNLIFRFRPILASLILILSMSLNIAKAHLKPAGMFGNNAILQQGIQVPIWGKATPGGIVAVSFAKYSAHTTADEKGKWMAYLPAMKADGQSYQLTIKSGGETITYSNIMLGEVWLASRQSNMEYMVGSTLLNKEDEIKNANYPNIRFRSMENITSIVPLEDTPQKDWKICIPQNVSSFSAVAYFFSHTLE